jgi:hypothetical protein
MLNKYNSSDGGNPVKRFKDNATALRLPAVFTTFAFSVVYTKGLHSCVRSGGYES